MWSWLVPAVGCFALVFSGIASRNPGAHSGNQTSEPGFANYNNHSEQNNVPVSHFALAVAPSGSSTSRIQFSYSDTNLLSY